MGLDGKSQSPQTSTGKLLSSMEDKDATEAILQEVGLSKSQYKMGLSQVRNILRSFAAVNVILLQVLLRYGTIANLEDRRNEKVTNIVTAFQARCRGYLARRAIEKKKVLLIN